MPPHVEEQDSWTAVRVGGQHVIANFWSCSQVHLNLDTGGEIARQFTK